MAEVARGRTEDVSFLLDRLTGGHPAWRHASMIDRLRVGMAGHSIGGDSAASTMAADRRVRAGGNMDGAFYAPVPATGLRGRPFMMLDTRCPAHPRRHHRHHVGPGLAAPGRLEAVVHGHGGGALHVHRHAGPRRGTGHRGPLGTAARRPLQPDHPRLRRRVLRPPPQGRTAAAARRADTREPGGHVPAAVTRLAVRVADSGVPGGQGHGRSPDGERPGHRCDPGRQYSPLRGAPEPALRDFAAALERFEPRAADAHQQPGVVVVVVDRWGRRTPPEPGWSHRRRRRRVGVWPAALLATRTSWTSSTAPMARTRWRHCQSSRQGQFRSGAIAVSCAACSAARSGSCAAHPNPRSTRDLTPESC